jgi:hypothetical protein
MLTCQYLPRWLDKRFTSLLTTHRVFPMPKNRQVGIDGCESDQWILTYQLSRSHDQGGRKLPPQKLMCCTFRPPIFFFCWSQTSILYYVLVSINVIMLLIISWNINIPRQFNNQWNHIRSIMARCNNIILYDSASMACESDQWILTYQLSRSHDQGGRKLPPQKLICGSFRPPIFFFRCIIKISILFVAKC